MLVSIALILVSLAHAQIKLPRLISDGMILQRETNVKLWGWAAPGEIITVGFNKKTFTTTADANGKWMVLFPPQKAGGPYEITFAASNRIVVKDILFGDVWICGGQSNMELMMERVKDKYDGVIAKASNPRIRQFLVPDKYDFTRPHEDMESGEWVAADAQSILDFTAVGYFFAADIFAKYNVPIGLINAALGGSPAEAWISEEALRKFPSYYNEAQMFKDNDLITTIESSDRKRNGAWYGMLNKSDGGLNRRWSDPATNVSDWPEMQIPGYWADGVIGRVNGSVWFRKEIDLPAHMVGKAARLHLGRIVDADSAYVNGKFVGTTSYQYPPRRYEIPPNTLRGGKNTIVVRVINSSGRGGFVPDKPYELTCGSDTIDLKGTWKHKLAATMEPLGPQTFIRWKPIGLFNAMIAPVLNYAIKGVIWYQGESNTKKPSEYADLMRTLIEDWRTRWQQGDFPFLFVQLANFMEARQEPTESSWAELRQAQLSTLTVPNTGMAVAIDVGEWNDIHPENKAEVGKRLALLARRIAYGDKAIVASGPLYRDVKREGNKLIISFADMGSGLATSDGRPPKHFAIAGGDSKFVWANAEIRGNTVIVWNDAIANPVAVRYAWGDNPAGANLCNKEGLPASPFEAKIK